MTNFWHNKKVLVTGAAGFVGSNAVNYLLQLGVKVTAAVSVRSSKKQLKKRLGTNIRKVKLIHVDLLKPEDAKKCCLNNEIVFNFAAVDGGLDFKNNHSAEVFSKNIRIALNMLDAAKDTKVKKYLLVSSADIYSSKQETPIHEDDPIEIDWKTKIDGYKLAKWTSELAAREFARQYGIDIVIVRPSNLYGPGDSFEDDQTIRFIPHSIRNVFLNKKTIELYGTGKQVRSFMYIEDFIKICCKLIEKGVFNIPINVASKNNVTLKILAQKIIDKSYRKIKPKIDINKPEGARVRKFNLSLLESKIGEITETDLDVGLEKTIKYFQE